MVNKYAKCPSQVSLVIAFFSQKQNPKLQQILNFFEKFLFHLVLISFLAYIMVFFIKLSKPSKKNFLEQPASFLDT